MANTPRKKSRFYNGKDAPRVDEKTKNEIAEAVYEALGTWLEGHLDKNPDLRKKIDKARSRR